MLSSSLVYCQPILWGVEPAARSLQTSSASTPLRTSTACGAEKRIGRPGRVAADKFFSLKEAHPTHLADRPRKSQVKVLATCLNQCPRQPFPSLWLRECGVRSEERGQTRCAEALAKQPTRLRNSTDIQVLRKEGRQKRLSINLVEFAHQS